jgi:hypothetical protein
MSLTAQQLDDLAHESRQLHYTANKLSYQASKFPPGHKEAKRLMMHVRDLRRRAYQLNPEADSAMRRRIQHTFLSSK